MMIKLTRQQWLLLAGIITAVLVLKTYLDDGHNTSTTVVEATHGTDRPDRRGKSVQEMPELLALEQIQKTRIANAGDDLFRSKSWYVPPPPPPPAPPPAPVTPPLPFSFMGKVREPDGRITLFLSDRSHVYLVHGGETLDQNYHVDGIEGGKLAFTYLPLNKKQYLNLVEAK